MATDHRGRGVHAGKRSDDEAYERSMRLAATKAARDFERQYKPYKNPAPDLDPGDPFDDETGETMWRPEGTSFDNPEADWDD